MRDTSAKLMEVAELMASVEELSWEYAEDVLREMAGRGWCRGMLQEVAVELATAVRVGAVSMAANMGYLPPHTVVWVSDAKRAEIMLAWTAWMNSRPGVVAEGVG